MASNSYYNKSSNVAKPLNLDAYYLYTLLQECPSIEFKRHRISLPAAASKPGASESDSTQKLGSVRSVSNGLHACDCVTLSLLLSNDNKCTLFTALKTTESIFYLHI